MKITHSFFLNIDYMLKLFWIYWVKWIYYKINFPSCFVLYYCGCQKILNYMHGSHLCCGSHYISLGQCSSRASEPKGREFILLKFVFLAGARTIIDIIFICSREVHWPYSAFKNLFFHILRLASLQPNTQNYFWSLKRALLTRRKPEEITLREEVEGVGNELRIWLRPSSKNKQLQM